MKEVFIVLGQPRNGLARKGVLEAIRESGKRGLSVLGLAWVKGAVVFFFGSIEKSRCTFCQSHGAFVSSARGGGIVGELILKNQCALNAEIRSRAREGYNGRS